MRYTTDISTWKRRDNYGSFRTYLNSWYPVTTEIDCTETGAVARRSGHSFFLYYLYAVLRSTNEVNELRYHTDKSGQVVFHDRADIIFPIAVPGRTFYTIRTPYHGNFEHFYVKACALITDIPENGDPCHAEEELTQQGNYDVVHLSAVPKMSFMSITYTVAEADNGYSRPLMTVGKVVPRGGRLVFPLSIYVNHALVDGSHLAFFFGKMGKYLEKV